MITIADGMAVFSIPIIYLEIIGIELALLLFAFAGIGVMAACGCDMSEVKRGE